MIKNIHVKLAMQRAQFESLNGELEEVSPTAILKRGYAIARALPHGKIFRSASDTKLGDRFGLTLANGELEGEVKKITGE